MVRAINRSSSWGSMKMGETLAESDLQMSTERK